MALILVILGVTLSVFGLLGLSIVIYLSFLIRKNSEDYSQEEKKMTFGRLIVINYLALSLAAFGLIIILLGLLSR
jgi:hypothetical protein